MNKLSSDTRVAVIGAGISGIAAAFYLGPQCKVTLFEKNAYLGGHTNTRVVLDGPDKGTSIDTGFIVCNPQNYPNFYRFLGTLGVNLRNSDMSFGFFSEASGLQYMGPSLRDFLRVPKNLFNADFRSMVWEQRRFNKAMLSDLKQGELENVSLGEYLYKKKLSRYFLQTYLMPLVGSIWSMPEGIIEDFPALTFAVFFKNHGMLELNRRPQWQTVLGGSHSYIKAFEREFKGKIALESAISHVVRGQSDIQIEFKDATIQRFDKVVFATHADEACVLLRDADSEERRLLDSWKYSRNRAVLHTDSRILPPHRSLWASWNYRQCRESSSQVGITYYMNRLQGLRTERDYFVTLNPHSPIEDSSVLYETTYTHPIYSSSTRKMQDELKAINGNRNTYFCGAYLGYGFHEDGMSSALSVVQAMGGKV